jgi:hypothetical protein
VVLDDSDPAVADGDHCALLDQLGRLALEEGVRRSALVGNNCTHKGALAVVALGLLGLDDANIDVVAVSGIDEAVNLHEGGNGQFGHNVEINYQHTKNIHISHHACQLNLD